MGLILDQYPRLRKSIATQPRVAYPPTSVGRANFYCSRSDGNSGVGAETDMRAARYTGLATSVDFKPAPRIPTIPGVLSAIIACLLS